MSKKKKHRSLIDKIYSPQNLKLAWEKVRANKGSAGVDRITITNFAENQEAYLDELHRQLKEDNYRPKPVKRVMIPRLRQEKGSKEYEFVLVFSEESGLDEDITICQDDIRAVQPGKSALSAGAQILMKHAGINETGEIILAGAFSSYIDIDDAITIGSTVVFRKKQ